MRVVRPRHHKPFFREAVRLASLSEVSQSAQLGEFLSRSRLNLTELEPDGPVDARFAHYTQTSLGMVSTPPIGVTWERDAVSRDRTVMVFARRGELEASSDAPIVRRGKTAVLFPPGDAPVELRATHAQNEFVYITSNASILPASMHQLRRDVQAPALRWNRIAPLYSFVHGLCSVQLAPDEAEGLAGATSAIVGSLVDAVLSDITHGEGVLAQAMALIAAEHQDSHLNASHLAERLGLSLRTLQAAFASEGLTVRAELRRARTATATRLLQTHPDMTQAQRALLSGFSSLSAFYRAQQQEKDATD